ncbi:hypothetical protein [Rhizobium wenxiniae]|uniref:hypothetical protein n=1 Tax=Rhizobium wenxiniae TaxID=1737357 RepID=UPI003C15BCBE
MNEYEHITRASTVAEYQSSSTVFDGLIKEIRELSKKKPDATMSAGKVKIVNRVLLDLMAFLHVEPEGKYLEKLDDDALPQVSDAVLVMVQFETALRAFKGRYHQYVSGKWLWVTEEWVAERKAFEERYLSRAGDDDL